MIQIGIVALISFLRPAFAYSQSELPNPLRNVKTFGDLVSNLGLAIIALAVPLAIVTIVWLGFQMLTHAGDPKKLSEIKTQLMWVLIGIAVAVGAGALAQAVVNFYKDPNIKKSFGITIPSPSSFQGQGGFQPQSQQPQSQPNTNSLTSPYVRDSDDVFAGDGFGPLPWDCDAVTCDTSEIFNTPDPIQKKEISFAAKLWIAVKEHLESVPPPGSTEPSGGSFGGGGVATFGNKQGERVTLPIAPPNCFQQYYPRVILLSNTIPNLAAACSSVEQAFKRLGASEYISLNERILITDSSGFIKLLQSGNVEEADSGVGIMLNDGSIALDGEKNPSINTIVHMMAHQMVDSQITRNLLQKSEIESLFIQSKTAGALVTQKASVNWYEFIAETAMVAADPKGNYTPVNTPQARAQFEHVYKWLEDKKIIFDSPLD